MNFFLHFLYKLEISLILKSEQFDVKQKSHSQTCQHSKTSWWQWHFFLVVACIKHFPTICFPIIIKMQEHHQIIYLKITFYELNESALGVVSEKNNKKKTNWMNKVCICMCCALSHSLTRSFASLVRQKQQTLRNLNLIIATIMRCPIFETLNFHFYNMANVQPFISIFPHSLHSVNGVCFRYAEKCWKKTTLKRTFFTVCVINFRFFSYFPHVKS